MEMCTAQGHLVGMLDRDQRTAKLCCFDRLCAVFVKKYENLPEQTARTRRNKTISHRSVPGRTSPHSSCKTRKNGHFWKSLHSKSNTVYQRLICITIGGAINRWPIARGITGTRRGSNYQ
jgi:hypothetical protein